MLIAERDWLGVYGMCSACGCPVSHYACNAEMIGARPQAANEDWWSACDNPECVNHYGAPCGHDDIPDWEHPNS